MLYSPRDSTSVSMAIRDIWTQLEESVGTVLSKGQMLIVGDLNARTGYGADHTLDSLVDDHCQLGPDPTCTDRNNQNAHVNSHGRELLRLCQRTGLRIVNGRVSGDETGAFTFVSLAGGASLIDYVVACRMPLN